MAPPSLGWHEAEPLNEPGDTKKSFSSAELDHVPRYIAPEDDHVGDASSAQSVRPVSAEWEPNALASFSGGAWVPPAVDHEEIAAYVAPKSTSLEPPRSPRNLIIAVVGIALVAGLGFGVSKALAPDSSTITPEPTSVETTTVTSRPGGRAPGPVGAAKDAVAAQAKAAQDADALGEDTVPTTPTP
jgi:hypothetical protein